MKELVELRESPNITTYLPEELMKLARCVGSISIVDVCIFELPSHDERWHRILVACEKLEIERQKQPLDFRFKEMNDLATLLIGDVLERGWKVHPLHGYSWVGTKRFYTKNELLTAQALQIIPYVITSFTRKKEDYDLIYDVSSKCKMCGLATQKSELIFQSIHFPKTKDIVAVMGYNEVIVSNRLAEILECNSIRGISVKNIYQRNRSKLCQIPGWKQLVVTSEVNLTDATKFGYDFFHIDDSGVERCKVCGLTRGQGVQSELFIDAETWRGNDIAVTRERVGGGTTVGSPLQLILISQRLYKLMRENNIKSYHAEVAQLV